MNELFQKPLMLKSRPYLPSLKLYKDICREIKKLPISAQTYYKDLVRSEFLNYADEIEMSKIHELIRRTPARVNWVKKKFNV